MIGRSIVDYRQATAGADHLVIFARTNDCQEIILKAGLEANVDAFVLKLLADTSVPVPQLLGESEIQVESQPQFLTIMAPAHGRVLAEEPHLEAYLPQLISMVHKVHSHKSDKGSGLLLNVEHGRGLTWKEYLLRILQSRDPEFDWEVTARRPEIDAIALHSIIDRMIHRVEALPELTVPSLLHGDLNPHNIFVQDGRISSMIDWSYARYGDPLFDFARLRMNPFVSENQRASSAYFDALSLNDEERFREQSYYLFNLLEYINWSVLDRNILRARHHLHILAQSNFDD